MTTPRKKRKRYRWQACRIADKLGLKPDLDTWEQVWAFLDKHKEHVFLYAIVDKANRMVKFGRSKSPAQRVGALKTGNASDLQLFAYCEHKSPFTEREVHKSLSEFHVSGEWFRLCEASRDMISRIRRAAGAID